MVYLSTIMQLIGLQIIPLRCYILTGSNYFGMNLKMRNLSLGGTVAANADVAYELVKKGWPYLISAGRGVAETIGRVVGAVGTGTAGLAAGSFLLLFTSSSLPMMKLRKVTLKNSNKQFKARR